jgi:RimJ/RimL family protein N-acetyltransferase
VPGPSMLGPDLAGPRIRLRAPTASDVPSFSRWFADSEVVRYWWIRDALWARRPGVAALLLYLAAGLSRTAVVWTIEHEGRPIGHCHIRHIDRAKGLGTTSVLIGERSARGKGFGCETVALRTEFAFGQLGLRMLRSFTLEQNTASRRMLEKSGYRLVGIAPADLSPGGRAGDVLLFELPRREYVPAAFVTAPI